MQQAIRIDNNCPGKNSQGFTDWAEQQDVRLFIQPCKPSYNAFIEWFSKRFLVEVLDVNLSNSISEVQMSASEWLMDYKEYRPHESLGDVPPAAFMPRVFERNVHSFKLST